MTYTLGYTITVEKSIVDYCIYYGFYWPHCLRLTNGYFSQIACLSSYRSVLIKQNIYFVLYYSYPFSHILPALSGQLQIHGRCCLNIFETQHRNYYKFIVSSSPLRKATSHYSYFVLLKCYATANFKLYIWTYSGNVTKGNIKQKRETMKKQKRKTPSK